MEDKNREQILNDFSKNILIEAGAGSGKTTILVNRILNQIETTEITLDKIVAITFTDKSAIELQDRFQAQLSKALQLATGVEKQKLKKAMADVDKIHISTIHSFCLSLLKEMPFEAGLSLEATVVQDQQDIKFKKDLFSNFCEADLNNQDLEINQLRTKLREVDINPEILQEAFFSICEKDGVTWVYDKDRINTEAQEFFNRCKKILELIQSVLSGEYDPTIGFTEEELRLGGAESEDQTPIIKEETSMALKWLARTRDQEPSSEILEIVTKLDKSINICVAQNSKSRNYDQAMLEMGKQVNKKLKELQLDLVCANLKEDYSRYRHALCMEFLIEAIANFNLEKKKEKKLTNKDLLVMARNMIRDSDVARVFFKAKYHCFYVDEFQDTDPIQTELLFYLASEQRDLPDNWEDCQLKDGTLCMVGDPKQSIYAFTGADIKLYNRVKEKMEKDENCVVYGLQRNYRSNKKICNWVENTFTKKSDFGFPNTKGPGNNQVVFEGMNAFAKDITNDKSTINGVYRYHIGAGTKDELVKRDAVFVADMVANLIESKTRINGYDTLSKTFLKREVSPGDFLILTWNTTHMSDYVMALKKRGLPVAVSGKIETKALEEVNNLVDLLDYLNDQNNYQLAVVLEKLFGCHLAEDKPFNYNHLLLNQLNQDEEFEAIQDENLKASLIYLKNLLDLTKEFSPMMVVERIINDFKVIRANKKYDAITLNEAMGNLEQVMEVIRSEPHSIFSDIVSRLKNLTESHLDREMSITDLIQEEGEYNAVRIMNLHKSKGLEGNIVILANPSTKAKGYPESVVLIDEADQKNGYLKIKTSMRKILGAPASWGEAECINDRSKAEEHLRLLYVASTRAKEALIVSSADTLERSKMVNHTAWKELEEFISCDDHTRQLFNGALNHEVLLRNSVDMEDRQSDVWGIVDIEDGFQKHHNQINKKIKQLQKSLINHVNPSKTIHKIFDEDQKTGKHNSEIFCFRGTLYGTIVHSYFQQLIEKTAISDERIDESELRIMIKKSVIAGLESEPLTEQQCELLKLDKNLENMTVIEQIKTIYNVLNDDLLKKYDAFCADEVFLKLIKQADAVHTEMPFQLMIRPEELIEWSLILTSNNKKASIRGVMDLVLVNGNNYTIIDFKTNSKEDEEENLAIFKDQLTAMYRPQLDLYEMALKKMMGASDVKSMLYVV